MQGDNENSIRYFHTDTCTASFHSYKSSITLYKDKVLYGQGKIQIHVPVRD